MAPLLTLRATVAGLAKGVMDLSPRAAVNTADEFGELAQDLNHFLDRIGVVVQDLDRILAEVVRVGARLGALNRGLEQQVDGLRSTALQRLGDDARRSLDLQLLAAREGGAFDALAQTLDTLARTGALPAAAGAEVQEQLARLRQSFAAVAGALTDVAPPVVVAQAQSAEYQALAQSLREMALLEGSMQQVAEAGQRVVQRLTQGRPERATTA